MCYADLIIILGIGKPKKAFCKKGYVWVGVEYSSSIRTSSVVSVQR
jgi:hypothetical protein